MAKALSIPSRNINIVLWILRVLMAALFLFAAFGKLTSQQMMVEEFAMLPVGDWFRYVVGLLELIGAVALLTPALSGLGALVLLVVDIGAFFAQVFFIHMDWIHTIVIGAILVALIYLLATRSANASGCEEAGAQSPPSQSHPAPLMFVVRRA